MGLKEFLVQVKDQLVDIESHPRIHIVIGNESCDMDSTISALVYAYFLHKTKKHTDTLFVPMMCILRGKFSLRLETLYFLNKHNIVADNLVFIDDLNLVALTQDLSTTLTVTLVDHHELTAAEECLSRCIIEVLDHRPQTAVLPESWRPHIELVGSCCTLVARKLLDTEDFPLDSTVAELLFGTILIDTGNMSTNDGVGTPVDRIMLDKLQTYLLPNSANSIYESIRNVKSNLSSLRVSEILHKDMKLLKGTHITVAMSSVTMKLEELLNRPEFYEDCVEFCSILPADVLMIMTLWKDVSGILHRGIAVFSLNRVYRKQISDVLLSSVSPNLELQQLTSFSYIENVSTFIQNNVQVFRKGVIPLIKKFLDGENTTPDENFNAVDDSRLKKFSDVHFSSTSSRDMSEGETQKYKDLGKIYQNDQLRKSQDRYDLAAVGMEPLISHSLSSDSEFSHPNNRNENYDFLSRTHEENFLDENKLDGINADEMYKNTSDSTFIDGAETGSGDGRNVDVLSNTEHVFGTNDGTFVNNITSVGFDNRRLQGHDDKYFIETSNKQQSICTLDLADSLANEGDGALNNTNMERLSTSEFCVDSNIDFLSDLDLQVTSSAEKNILDVDLLSAEEYTKDVQLDDFPVYNDFNILITDNAGSPFDISLNPTSNQTSGQGSTILSSQESPSNNCIKSSNVIINEEIKLASSNSSETVMKVHEKKVALTDHHDSHHTNEGFSSDNIGELFITKESSRDDGGSHVLPKNIYTDLVEELDFQSPSHQLPQLRNCNSMEQINEKKSKFEWSIESLEGTIGGINIQSNSNEDVQQSPLLIDSPQGILINTVVDHQVPYTPQNSYVEEQMDMYARSNLPNLNNSEFVAKIKAKQIAMFGSDGSSRVNQSSHENDDSRGCSSPEAAYKNPRGVNLDSPQVPYTPQNSFGDNLAGLESHNYLPDLYEVAEILSSGNALKNKLCKKSTNNSLGGSHDEENIHLHNNQQSQHRSGRNSSSQSDSQNTMSDVDSLMSMSADIAVSSDNIVATALANQMSNEITLGRKDTSNSYVFLPIKSEETTFKDFAVTIFNHFDILSSENMVAGNIEGTDLNRKSEDSYNDMVINGQAGLKELFSPIDSSKVYSIEEHALYKAAESIVALSVAAAVESSKRNIDTELKKESRLQSKDNHSTQKYFDFDKDEKTRNISKNTTDNGLGTVESQNTHTFDDLHDTTEQTITDSIVEPQLKISAHAAQPMLIQELYNNQVTSQYKLPQNEMLLFLGPDPEISNRTPLVSLAEQNITDFTLNELAFELANELIQRVLDDFPFSCDRAHTEVKVQEDEPNSDGFSESDKSINKSEDKHINIAMNNVSGSVESDDVLVIKKELDFDEINSIVPSYIEDILHSSTSSFAKEDLSINKTVEFMKQTQPLLQMHPLSSIFEKNRSRDSDLSVMIKENKILTTFPERNKSADSPDEEDIQVFPGRKFSKSDDFPSRRFSREENSSKRSSKLEDQDVDVIIHPEEIETVYLPNMDPFQGNFGIIDRSFSKIINTNQEVVEGESFRKISAEKCFGGNEVDDDVDFLDKDKQREDECLDESIDDTTAAMENESEFEDIVNEKMTERKGSEQIVDSPSDLPNQPVQTALVSKSSDLEAEPYSLDIETNIENESNQFVVFTDNEINEINIKSKDMVKQINVYSKLVEQTNLDSSNFEDTFSKINVSNVTSLQSTENARNVDDGDTHSDSDKFAEMWDSNNAYMFNDHILITESKKKVTNNSDKFNAFETIKDVFKDGQNKHDEELIKEDHVPKKKKKIQVSFSEDFDDEIGDFNITSSTRSPLKSPPPILPSAEGSGALSSSVEDISFTGMDDEDSAQLFSHLTPFQNLYKKEIYHSSAGRMSISLGEESDGTSFVTDGSTLTHLESCTDQTIGKARTQVDEIIASAKLAISDADDELVIKDNMYSPSSNSSNFLDSLDFFKKSSDIGVTSENDYNKDAEQTNTNLNSSNFDLRTVCSTNSNNSTSLKNATSNSQDQSNHYDSFSEEPSAVMLSTLSFSQQQPDTSSINQFDSFTSLPTHIRNLSSASAGSVQGAVYNEEWQDDEIVEVAIQTGIESSPDTQQKKKLMVKPVSEDITDNDVEMEDDKNEDDQDSDVGDLEWENDTPVKTPDQPVIEPTLGGNPISSGIQRWKRVSISGTNFDIDMQAVEPFRNVLSHGGYYDEGLCAIFVFYGCNLPSSHSENYVYTMDHLFHYVIHTLEELVADDYVIIYFHGSTPKRQMPSLGWFKRCYQSIDRRLRKNLKGLFLVHPTLWLRTVVMMTKPFISIKFTSKLRFVRTLEELNTLVPLNNVSIPEPVVHFDIYHKHMPTPPESPYHTHTSE